jgi:hypothetical protein
MIMEMTDENFIITPENINRFKIAIELLNESQKLLNEVANCIINNAENENERNFPEI